MSERIKKVPPFPIIFKSSRYFGFSFVSQNELPWKTFNPKDLRKKNIPSLKPTNLPKNGRVGSYDRFLLRRLGLFSGTNRHGQLRKGISTLRGGPTCSMVNQRPGSRELHIHERRTTRRVHATTKAPRKTVVSQSPAIFFDKWLLLQNLGSVFSVLPTKLFGICLPNGCCFINPKDPYPSLE